MSSDNLSPAMIIIIVVAILAIATAIWMYFQIKRLAEVFAGERQKLEAEWDKNDNVSTEDLRVALRRYRSFFDRLLSV
jgi:predicted Holliday junction resolvase-like endonuclease